jgi:predicted nuclease of restriction endonuclease-like (RecB) superfamily
MKFDDLKISILAIDEGFRIEAGKSVNRLLTMRNWLMGFYIVEFEQNGEERAKYSGRLLENLAATLNTKRFSITNLKLSRLFYLAYPHFKTFVSAMTPLAQIRQTASDEFQLVDNQVQTAKDDRYENLRLPVEQLIGNLSFSHFTLLTAIENPLARIFYEIESIKGGWSVRELKRQIESLLFERTGLSQDKEKLIRRIHDKAETPKPEDLIRSPYIFEFLGFPENQLMDEGVLEKALLDHLQQFLLELGTGFCFEGRQKRILIGDDWHWVDLVFYHRILKCHVIVDLKTEKFKPDHAGQMNAYVNYYKDNEMRADDHAPVGILLCTEKNHAAVRYALGGLDEQIFVSQYKLLLPDEAILEEFIEREKTMLLEMKNQKTELN